MRKCPNGHDVSDDVKYCPKCGAEIQENVAEDIRFCKKCGQERKGAENSALIVALRFMAIQL